jgi:hypothetical protein
MSDAAPKPGPPRIGAQRPSPSTVGSGASSGAAVPMMAMDEFVDVSLIERVPFIFSSQVQYLKWRRQGAVGLNVDPRNIILVGSAAHGFSVKSGKLYEATSDVDVAVVSHMHFEQAWQFMKTARIGSLKATQFQKEHLREYAATYVYNGCVATDYILPLLPFGPDWSRTAASLARALPGGVRTINFRLYRDIEALRSYQIYSHKKLRVNWESYAPAVS